MFTANKCLCPDCNDSALSTIDFENDAIKDFPGYCINHSPNVQETTENIIKYVQTHEKIIGLNANGITFENMDFSNKKFYGCSFQHCTFLNIQAPGARFRVSFFDFSVFSDCNLQSSNVQFSSFAGSTFSHVIFTGSDLVHANFCGISAYQSSFDDADLYNSRFIDSTLNFVSFRNCNLKNANFMKTSRTDVSFKLSNTRSAVFSPEDKAFEKAEFKAAEEDAVQLQLRYRDFEADLGLQKLIDEIRDLAKESNDEAAAYWKSHDPDEALARADTLITEKRFDTARDLLNKLKSSPKRGAAVQMLKVLGDAFCNEQRKTASVLFKKSRSKKDPEQSTNYLLKAIDALDRCLANYPDFEQKEKVLENKAFLESELKK